MNGVSNFESVYNSYLFSVATSPRAFAASKAAADLGTVGLPLATEEFPTLTGVQSCPVGMYVLGISNFVKIVILLFDCLGFVDILIIHVIARSSSNSRERCAVTRIPEL